MGAFGCPDMHGLGWPVRGKAAGGMLANPAKSGPGGCQLPMVELTNEVYVMAVCSLSSSCWPCSFWTRAEVTPLLFS